MENQQEYGDFKRHIRANGFIWYLQSISPLSVEYTDSSRAHGMFSRVDHLLWHKMSLNQFQKAETISNFFSDHSGMELEINHKKYPEKHTKTWKLNNMLLNYQ